MLKNCVNKLLRKTQTAMQDSSTENCSRKNAHLMMWALFNLLTRRYLPRNRQNNWLYAAAATKKKASQQNHFANQRSVKVSDDASWQVKIGLHQFDNCLSQVKADVTTITNSCFCHTQDVSRVLHLSAGQWPGTQSFLPPNVYCFEILS